jgi:hypothetical protein
LGWACRSLQYLGIFVRPHLASRDESGLISTPQSIGLR